MRRPVMWMAAFGVVGAVWTPALAGDAPGPAAWHSGGELSFDLTAEHPVELPDRPWTPRVEALPGPAMEDLEKAAVRLSLPSFTNSVSVAGKRYTFTQLGADPSRSRAPNTVLPVVIIKVAALFDDGSFFAPDQFLDPCAPRLLPAATLVAQSPIFQPADYGDGARQYVEEFRRLEFWSLTGARGGRNPNYSVTVAPNWLQVGALVKFHGFPTMPAPCGRIGLVDIKVWDSLLRQTAIPAFRQYGAGPGSLVLFLLSNVVFYDGDQKKCCTLGYHSWFNLGGIQTYGVAEIDSSQDFKNVFDVGVLAHELGEWYDDPLVNNVTPRWGHVGQVSGCQSNLEVGDPLSGHFLEVAMPNGVTYHPQELAFFSWFFGQKPSLGFDGWYSMGGTFRTPASPCH